MEEIRSSLAPDTPVEVWFQDEMRVGQKNKLTYRWARKGSRPRAAHDQRTQSTYLFGAVCPELGTGAALVLPFCNSEAMQLHLDEIATKVGAGAHAIIILDQAGWHGAKELKVPHNISLLPLPPRSPELNSQENIWQFMRQNWLSNRVFKSYDDIVDRVYEGAMLGRIGILNQKRSNRLNLRIVYRVVRRITRKQSVICGVSGRVGPPQNRPDKRMINGIHSPMALAVGS